MLTQLRRPPVWGGLALILALAACETTPTNEASKQGTGGTSRTSDLGMVTTPPVARGAISPFSQPGGDRVHFALDRYDLDEQARGLVAKWAEYLRQAPSTRFTIEGHADERGTREYNLALGDRRAMAVRDYLVAQGVPASRLRTVSYGKERPAQAGSNEQSWVQNRRAVAVTE
jgi:peptidoglycan-associated lipoprotein